MKAVKLRVIEGGLTKLKANKFATWEDMLAWAKVAAKRVTVAEARLGWMRTQAKLARQQGEILLNQARLLTAELDGLGNLDSRAAKDRLRRIEAEWR
jgi:hypothetical protein